MVETCRYRKKRNEKKKKNESELQKMHLHYRTGDGYETDELFGNYVPMDLQDHSGC